MQAACHFKFIYFIQYLDQIYLVSAWRRCKKSQQSGKILTPNLVIQYPSSKVKRAIAAAQCTRKGGKCSLFRRSRAVIEAASAILKFLASCSPGAERGWPEPAPKRARGVLGQASVAHLATVHSRLTTRRHARPARILDQVRFFARLTWSTTPLRVKSYSCCELVVGCILWIRRLAALEPTHK